MNVAHQFPQIRIFLAQKGFISILKQMSIPAMTAVELLGITGEQPAHDGGDGSRAGSEEHVGMVGHQGPGITRRRGISQNMTQTFKKVLMVLRIFKYDPALDSPDDNWEGEWQKA